MSSQPSSLLPAFLAGFVAAAGLGAALVPSLNAPYETQLRTAREEAASAQRQLAQDRALASQLDLSREATDRLAKDSCKRETLEAVSEAVAGAATAARRSRPTAGS